MPIDLQQVSRGQQRMHGHLLDTLADNLRIGGMDAAVIGQIIAGQDADRAIVCVGLNRPVPRREFLPRIVAFENERVIVGLGFEGFRIGPHHGDNAGIGEPGRHQEIVRVVIAVMNVKNNFIYHREFACKNKDVPLIEIYHFGVYIHRKGLTMMNMDPTLSLFAQEALMQQLDAAELAFIAEDEDNFELGYIANKILKCRKKRAKPKNITHRLNYPIEEVLDDYVNHRTGKVVEAKRQLKKRFDGLDHGMQEKVMMALMEHGGQAERDFVYDKLYGEDFWTDDYIPLIQKWFREFPDDWKLGKVIVKYCSREYILRHLEELEGRCNYATLCLRTGLPPREDKLNPRTYLYVLKCIGGQMGFREGRRMVFKHIREYLYEEGEGEPVNSIYDIPYVKRMMAYLGEMGLAEDIMALDAFDKKMHPTPRRDWGTTVIKAIEDEFTFPPYVYKEVK